MKWKMIASCVASLLILMVLLAGCDLARYTTPFTHTFRQDQSDVERIEICTYQDGYPVGTITPLVQLQNEEVDSFWTDILNLECRETLKLDTPSGYGDIIFLVTYHDGEKEIISLMWLGHISTDGVNYESLRYFDPIELSTVFAKYADPELLAEDSEYFKHYWNLSKEE